MIEVRDLVKTFGLRGGTVSLDHVSLKVPKESIFGLLGTTGSGKTTFLRILGGTLQPDSGMVEVDGHVLPREARAVWRAVALVPERRYFAMWDTVGEYLRFWGRVAGLPGREAKARIADLADLMGLNGIEDLDLARLTVDVEARINLMQALLTDPAVLLLDEPFTGIAAPQREGLTELLRTLQRRGKTIVLTASHLQGVRRSCDRVVVLEEGRVLGDMRTEDLLARIGQGKHARIFVDAKDPGAVVDAAKAVEGVIDAKATRDVVVVYVNPDKADRGTLEEAFKKRGVQSDSIRDAEITLGDVFRALHQGGRG